MKGPLGFRRILKKCHKYQFVSKLPLIFTKLDAIVAKNDIKEQLTIHLKMLSNYFFEGDLRLCKVLFKAKGYSE